MRGNEDRQILSQIDFPWCNPWCGAEYQSRGPIATPHFQRNPPDSHCATLPEPAHPLRTPGKPAHTVLWGVHTPHVAPPLRMPANRHAHISLCTFLTTFPLNLWHAASCESAWRANFVEWWISRPTHMCMHNTHARLGGRSWHTSLGVPDSHTLVTGRKPSMGQCCQSMGIFCLQCHLADPFAVGGRWYGKVHTSMFISVPYPISTGSCCMHTLIANTTHLFRKLQFACTWIMHPCTCKTHALVSHPIPPIC